MEQYRIEGLITAQTTALTLKPAAGPKLKIALGGWRNDAALFEDDRRILDVSHSPAFVTAWRLRQDDVLRARILDRGLYSSPGPGEGFFRRLKGVSLEVAVDLGVATSTGLKRRYDAWTERGICSIYWPVDGWEITFFAPGNRGIGRVLRVPSGYIIEIEPGADRFLVLGLALFVFLQFYENSIRVRDDSVRQTWIVNPVSPGRPPRRHRSPRDRRRKWIDDPLGSRPPFPRGRYGIDDPDPDPERKWIDNPVPEPNPVQIDDPKPEPEPVRIDDPQSQDRG